MPTTDYITLTTILTIVIWILIFMLLVIGHEFGHFFAARKSGVKVLEFGIGIPPKIKKIFTDKKWTEYTINAIPLGWFCRMKGEDPEEKESINAKDSILNVNIFKKTFIILGGIIMNLIMAWILFAITFMIGTKPFQILPDSMTTTPIKSYLMPSHSFALEQGILSWDDSKLPVVVEFVAENTLASELWIEKWDTIISVNNEAVSAQNLSTTLQQYIGKEITVKYGKTSESNDNLWEIVLEKSWKCQEESCLLGISIKSNITTNTIKVGFFKAFWLAGQEIRGETKLTFSSLGKLFWGLFSGNKEEIKQTTKGLAGPVGAIKVGQLFAQTNGFAGILAFSAMISLALAIFNLLPIPALDGWRGLSMWIQYLFRLPKEKYFKIEGYVNFIFFITLMGAGILIILQDLSRFWGISIPFFG